MNQCPCLSCKMDFEPDGSIKSFYSPFFNNSVNILSSATSSGKTYFLCKILEKRDICFPHPVSRAVVVLCNPLVDGSVYKNLETDDFQVETVYLDSFSIDQLIEGDILIFEDINTVTKDITDCINVFAHHLNLTSLFLVCQSILSSEDFKLLLSLSHRIFIYLSGAAGIKLFNYIKQYFFASSDLKEYLKIILSNAEKSKSIVLFELNESARKDRPKYLAITGIENFLDGTMKSPGTIVYPQMNKELEFEEIFGDNTTEVDNIDPKILPKGSYLLVPAANVKKKSQQTQEGNKDNCETDWETLNYIISEEINSALKFKQRQPAIQILKSMLGNKKFCFTKNGSTVVLHDNPKTALPVLDYLNTATRMSGPNEIPDQRYVLFTKILLQARTPTMYFKNKSLLYGKKPKLQIHQRVKKLPNLMY